MDKPVMEHIGVGDDNTVQKNDVHSPYVICVRAPSLSTPELLAALGMSHLQHASLESQRSHRSLFVLHDTEWIVAADDWLYTLWQDPEKPRRLRTLAAHGEVFAFAMGDSDDSYDLWRFRDGVLIRRRVVTSPNYNDRLVVVDDGEWEAHETDELYALDALVIRRRILASLGIDLPSMRIQRFAEPSSSR